MSNPFQLWNPWLSLSVQATRMCWEAQSVMALRLLRIVEGGAKAEAEAQRMITEKIAALAEAQMAAAATMMKGGKNHQVTKKAVGVYEKRVRRNRRRLMK